MNWSFWTMNAEFSIGALPSPVMSRAPSNTVTPPVCVWPFSAPGGDHRREETCRDE